MGIILASASPRRRELLRNMGIRDFETVPSSCESPIRAGIPVGDAVEEVALLKARDVAARYPNDIVIAADTLVFLDGTPLGKPRDAADAARMLSALSGREHEVVTGLAVSAAGVDFLDHSVTTVRFRDLSPREIDWYVASGEPLDKAGAYGIQGLGGLFVEGISGDYYNVVGLPISKLALMLSRAGVDLFCKGEGH